MKTVFYNGNFNRDGRRIRAEKVADIEVDGSTVTIYNGGDSMAYMTTKSGYLMAFNNLEHVKGLIERGSIAEMILKLYQQSKDLYEKGIASGKFIDYNAAAILDIIPEVMEHNDRYKVEYEKERERKNAEKMEAKRVKKEQEAAEHMLELELFKSAIINNKTIHSNTYRKTNYPDEVYVSDCTRLFVDLCEVYGVVIPLRTRGFILNNVNYFEFKESGLSYNYQASKKGRGSEKLFEVARELRKAIGNNAAQGNLN